MHIQEIFDLTLTIKVTWSIALYIMWPMYLQSLKLLQRIVKEMHFQEKNIIWSWPLGQGGQGHMKCCPVPSTSCDLCTSKVWCCYIQWLRRKCIYKKIHYLTLTSRGQGHTKCCPVPLTSCDLCTSKVWYCYIPRLRRRCIYKKIHYLTLTKCCPVPSISCDLCTYRVWLICLPGVLLWLSGSSSQCHGVVCGLWLWYFLIILTYYFWSYYIKRFRRRCIYKKIQYLTLTLGSMSQEMLRSALYIMWPIQLQSLKLLCLTD